MDPHEFSQRLSQISTQWTQLLKAHEGTTNTAQEARAILLQRYGGAVFRYLLGAVRDVDAAEELSHEFVVRFLRGDFQRAHPQRGRFRDYLKTALINLVNDYFRSRQRQPRALESVAPDPPAATSDTSHSATDFTHCWREELLERSWVQLERTRPNYHAVLRLRVQNPDMPAREMAEQLTSRLGKQWTPDTIRKTLERARVKFADLLVDEVATSLESSDLTLLQAELKELDLLRYCSAALQRRK